MPVTGICQGCARRENADNAAITALRERKKLDTRRRLEMTALDLFLERGYDATTVDDIAGAAHVSVRTLYRYFPAKDAMLFAGFDRPLATLLAALRTRDRSLPPLQSLQQALIGAADVMDDVSQVLKHIWQLGVEAPSLLDLSLKEIARWRNAFIAELAEQAGVEVFDARVQVLGIALHGTLSAGVAQWRGRGGRGALAEEFRRAVALLSDMSVTAADVLR
jgi:AcrR family transcriptional regulator